MKWRYSEAGDLEKKFQPPRLPTYNGRDKNNWSQSWLLSWPARSLVTFEEGRNLTSTVVPPGVLTDGAVEARKDGSLLEAQAG